MPDGPPPPDHESVAERLLEAAYAAERETGRREETEEEVRRGVIIRVARMVGGFVLIGIGISLLVLPGPGWVMIIIGLSLLPFAWAERTIKAIRQKVPGVPDDGAIPLSTWIIMGVVMVAGTVGAILFGDVIGRWIGDAWEAVWS